MKDVLKIFSGEKVLITGGLGFIGSNLARHLIDLGADVTLVDSLIPQYGGNLFNISDIRDKVTVNICDVRDPFAMKHIIRDKKYLFNLAGQTSHMDSMADPQTDLSINVAAQISILETCRIINPTIKIVFAGTRQIYGKPVYLPVDEKHPIRPVDVNGINKLSGEWYHILYNNVYGVRSCALRLTNTYGPRMRIKDDRQTFVGIWIRQAIENNPFEVWGGEQLRDFTYVDDCVNAMIQVAVNENAYGKCYNLGGCEVVSLKDLAEIIVENCDAKYVIKKFPEERKKIDIGDYYSDFSMITSDIGWKPNINLRLGLKNTVEYFSKHMKEYI